MSFENIYELLRIWFISWLVFQMVNHLGRIFASLRNSYRGR